MDCAGSSVARLTRPTVCVGRCDRWEPIVSSTFEVLFGSIDLRRPAADARGGTAAVGVARPGRIGRRGRRRDPATAPRAVPHLQRRPQHQLHQHLHSRCRFCAFAASPGEPEGYVLGRDELFRKIEETVALGGDQILLQGGMHPDLDLAWYEQLLRDIKGRFPRVNVHGFGPPEIVHIAAGVAAAGPHGPRRLKDAGLGSLPGGGAEILVDRVRQAVSPCKASADQWLEVCRAWHELGGRGSATMMFGHVETLPERIEHLERLRRLQDQTRRFYRFYLLDVSAGPYRAGRSAQAGAWEYLKTLAVSRLYLDNFANVQASWVTQGLEIGQMSLRFGANDLGSVMIEENVVAAAGTRFRASESELAARSRRRAIFRAAATSFTNFRKKAVLKIRAAR